MRKIGYSTLLFLLLSLPVLAQNGGINFQGMARNAAGEALANQKISLRLSVLLNSESGTVEYSETKEATTSGQGIFSVVVGDGSILTKTGNFSDINWKNSPKFLKVELDPSGGNNFALMGTSKLQAVPFAYYANGVDADNIQGTLPVAKGGTGVASITALKTNLGLDQVNNTSDANKPLSTATQTALNTKVDKVTGKELSSNDFTTAEKTKLAAITGTNTGDQDLSGYATLAGLAGKVDKVTGKDLSTNDYTTAEKNKLAAITGTNTGDQDLSGYATLAGLAGKVDKVTGKDLSTNDYTTAEKNKLAAITGTNTGDQDLSGYATTAALATKANTSDVTTSLALKENAANKSAATNLGGSATSDDLFPTQKAVKTYVDGQVSTGGIQDGAIQTRHLANGAVTGIKLVSDITGYKKFLDGAGSVSLSNTVSTDLDVNTGSVAVGGISNWQSFTAGLSGKLTAVDFQTINPSSSGPAPVAYVEVYADQGLGGTLLGTSANISISGMGRNWYSFDLGSASVNLIAGSVYTARLVVNSTNQNYVYGDNALYNAGISNISPSWDLNIRTKIKQYTNDSFLTTSAANTLYGSIGDKANSSDVTTALAGKVDKVTGKDLSSNDYTTAEKTKLAAITGTNTGDQDLSGYATTTALASKANASDVTSSLALKANTADITTALSGKVDKVTGKELSSNDFTTAEKNKLAGITGTNTGDQTTITGNAGTATKLATPKNINGVAFDGSTDITVTAAAGTLTGTTLNSTVTGSSLTSLGTLTNATINGKVIVGTSSATSSSAVLEANSTTQGFLPPRMTAAQKAGIASPVAGLVLWCTNCGSKGELQVFNGVQWTNMIGNTAQEGIVLGGTYQGGIVAYILQPSDPGYIAGEIHGLIVGSSDLHTGNGIRWNNGSYITTGTTATAIGTGFSNTNTIITVQGPTATSYAAGLARAYNGGGFNDWFLPSRTELDKIIQNRVVIGGLSLGLYWSSTEEGYGGAIAINTVDGSTMQINTGGTCGVRPVRTF